MTKICVVGTGYVGTGAVAYFIHEGYQVLGVDINPDIIARLSKGELHIAEPGIPELISKGLSEERLEFTTNVQSAFKKSDVILICVGTPAGAGGEADLRAVVEVARTVGRSLNGYKLVIIKSTVPVGTNDHVEAIISKESGGSENFDVVSNPEFLREGHALEDMLHPDRTVVGVESSRAEKILRELYSGLDAPFVVMDRRSSELVKYASNVFLALKITFANQLANLAENTGANVTKVVAGMGYDNRIGHAFLGPGIGFGGPCFPKDVKAFGATGRVYNTGLSLADAVISVNMAQIHRFVEKILHSFGENLEGVTIACWGLAFKGGTDDARESPAVNVVRMLRGYGATIQAFDPSASENAKHELGVNGITYCGSALEALEGADALAVLTDWSEFAAVDPEKLLAEFSGSCVFDGRNMLLSFQDDLEEAGISYFPVGVSSNAQKPLRTNLLSVFLGDYNI